MFKCQHIYIMIYMSERGSDVGDSSRTYRSNITGPRKHKKAIQRLQICNSSQWWTWGSENVWLQMFLKDERLHLKRESTPNWATNNKSSDGEWNKRREKKASCCLARNCQRAFHTKFHAILCEPEPKRQVQESVCAWVTCVNGAGLVTRGSVCCLSSSRCSNIFFFVMMPNTILKTNTRYWEKLPRNNK